MQKTIYKKRLYQLQLALKNVGEIAYLVSDQSNLAYLLGIARSQGNDREFFLLVQPEEVVLFVSPLLIDAYKGSEITVEPLKVQELMGQLSQLKSKGIKELYVDDKDLKMAEFISLKEKSNLQIEAGQKWVEKMRVIKDKSEIDSIKKACQITKLVWERVKVQIKPGKSEKDIADLIVREMKELGADGIPTGFKPIVASGLNSAIPHHRSGERLIQKDDVVLVDFGCSVDGYASDMTRMLELGKQTDEYSRMKAAVLAAYKVGFGMSRPGVEVEKIDRAVRDKLVMFGFGDLILHTTGHGLGLDIHEPPVIGVSNGESVRLEAGMAITIEPGLYATGKFGYRYENTILINNTKATSLTGVEV